MLTNFVLAVDLTVKATLDVRNSGEAAPNASASGSETDLLLPDEERGLIVPSHSVPVSVRSVVSAPLDGSSASTPSPRGGNDPQQQQGRKGATVDSANSSFAYIKQQATKLLEVVTPVSFPTATGDGLAETIAQPPQEQQAQPKLETLVREYKNSEIAREIEEEMRALQEDVARTSTSSSPSSNTTTSPSNNATSSNGGPSNGISNEPVDALLETSLLRGRKRASWGTQFRILSGRAFKNLYRDPALLAAHYLSAIGLACIFFFTLALFGFSCLSSLGLFANERVLFMRERANGYYSTFTYFTSKILFDILPLRLVPPLMYGGIVYGLVGLVPTVTSFWKFMLTLVLFNLTTASVILMLSVAFESVSVASLVGTLVMLFNLLFTGLLINRASVSPWLEWLHTVSFFHAAFEALAVNELRYLQLKEHKYGVDLDVPAATILSTFGLRSQSFWWPNITLLGIFFVTFTTASFIILHFYVKERR
ncbi:hypothetical protein MD484_g4023, partial [Candolleomyces efflorescens]